jgi:hypothetical protein
VLRASTNTPSIDGSAGDRRRQRRPVFAYLWALPCTLLGLLAALPVLGAGGSARVERGVLEVARRRGEALAHARARRWPFVAITLGHVVLGTSEAVLDRWRVHEHAHVRQYEQWGVLFLVAYPLASCMSRWRGEGWYLGNRFEREARAADGTRAEKAAEANSRPLPR